MIKVLQNDKDDDVRAKVAENAPNDLRDVIVRVSSHLSAQQIPDSNVLQGPVIVVTALPPAAES